MIAVGPDLFLTEIRRADRELLVEYLQEIEIHENTLRLPYPYTLACADEWIALNEQWLVEKPVQTQFAIRNGQGLLMGSAGFHEFELGKSQEVEIGYWLAKPFWGKGYMTAVIGKLVEIGFTKLGFNRITADIFKGNNASARCLEKNGFRFEVALPRKFQKGNRVIDAERYAKELPPL